MPTQTEKTIHLYAEMHGQTESITMSVTEPEWSKMSDEEQGDLIREHIPDLVNIWTEEKVDE